MTAFLEFDVQHKANVPRVPAAALRFTPPITSVFQAKTNAPSKPLDPAVEKKLPGAPATVYIKDKLGTPSPLAIRIGESNGLFYELLSNELKPGDEVITGIEENPATVSPIKVD